MTKASPYWLPLPTATQLRLLRLVLSPSLDRDALAAWTAGVDLQTLDAGSVRLLPSLYLRLNEAGIEHPWLPIMRGWYRRSLYRNRLIIHRGLDLVLALEARGLRSLLLKGTPLITLYYRDPGSRPMGDFDILVDESLPRREVEAVLAEDCRATLKNRSLHADTYLDPDGFEYDLHWYLVPELAIPGQAKALWSRAIDVTLEGRRFSTLSAEDHLFHAIIHGMRVSDTPPMRWIVDVVTIERRAAEGGRPIDWLAIAERAESWAIAAPLARGLGFLIDSGLLGEGARAAQAAAAAAPQNDSLLFAGLMREPDFAFRTLRPWLLYRRLVRLSPAQGQLPAAGFRRFLAELWNLDSPRQVPGMAWRKMLAQLRNGPAEG